MKMSKFYFNNIAGNYLDGYRLKYFDDNEKEFDFIINPESNKNSTNKANMHIKEFSNQIPYKPMINTVMTPSTYFDYAEDMSFFDPMSVSYLTHPFHLSTNYLHMTSKADAFPMRKNGFFACNHLIQRSIDEPIIPSIRPMYSYNLTQDFGDYRSTNLNTIVEDQYKKDVFALGGSTNIAEIELQYNQNWNDLILTPELSGQMIGVEFPISSNDEIDFTSKLSFSHNTATYPYVVPSGVTYLYASTSDTAKQNEIKKKAAPRPKRFSIEDTLIFESVAQYTSPLSSSNTAQDIFSSEGFPSSFYFVDEAFLLSSAQTTGNNILLMPVYNDNDMEDMHFTVHYTTNSQIPPASAYINLRIIGAIKMWKNIERNKWELRFSSPVGFFGDSSQMNVGHFECDLSKDPWLAPTDENACRLTYVDVFGNPYSEPTIVIYPFKYYYSTSVGVQPPALLGDNRWGIPSYLSVGRGIDFFPRVPLNPDRYQKTKTFVCVDSASYTIAI
jgi:hypothetical protein